MILIGQYDSSFVRRVGVALRLYDIPFEHRPWSVFSDAEKVRAYNPLMRVPVMVLDDGTSLIDSQAMLDHLDRRVGPERAMIPVDGPARDRALRLINLATGLGDKTVSLFYEIHTHAEASPFLVERLTGQLLSVLDALESERASVAGPYLTGDRIGHADIAMACMMRHCSDALPEVVAKGQWPHLRAHCARLEAMPVFEEISQPFIPPKG